MPKIGLSFPYIADYSYDASGGVTYSNGVKMGRAVSYSTDVSTGDDNNFYADNQLAESESGTFSSGTLTITTAELTQGVSMKILGLQQKTIEVGEQQITLNVSDDRAKAPNLGFGVIEKLRINGADKYRAVILLKVKFNIPNDAADTQGETIEWQTAEATASIMRDDTENHAWKYDVIVDSESMADAVIRQVLNITDATLETLTVQSAAGTAQGDTKLTVTPELTEGRTYRYATGQNVSLPTLYQDLSSWSPWNGTDEIAATSGEKIVVAEVDNVGLTMAAGETTVTANAGT